MGKKPKIIRDKLKDKIINDIWTSKEERKKNEHNNYMEHESNSDKNRDLSLDEYFNKIESYLRNIIISLQNSDASKIQSTIAIDFIFSKDAEEERVIHSSSGNMKFTHYSDANDVIEKLLKSLCSRYQENSETSMKGSDSIFDSVQLMYYNCHKVNFKRGSSYTDSPDWIKKKKATINPKNTDNNCFQYAATIALNYKETESHPERVSNIEPFIKI